jgi:DNA processing protein
VPSNDLRARLALWRVPGIGSLTFLALMQRFGSPASALGLGFSAYAGLRLRQESLNALASPDWRGVEDDLAWVDQPGHSILLHSEPEYPEALRHIPDAPPLLFVDGHKECLNDPQVAIVGTRNPSPGGSRNAEKFAADLAASGLTITSGLALGIDGRAHRGTLKAGGITIAVKANGLDSIYPVQHRDLAAQIRQSGALVSEFPIGTPPRAEHFPRRNRIISGLALGVVVIEAAKQSGSLITARYALEQGRELFAMPGSIFNPMTAGCHRLIRDGAKLVERAEHVLEELAPLLGSHTLAAERPESPEERVDPEAGGLLDLLGYDPCHVEELVQRSGLTPETVSSMLLSLELKGFVAADARGRYTRLGKNRCKNP